jgi:hypothetical protein
MSTDNVIKFRPSPAQVSETGINELWDYAVALMHSEAARLLNADAVLVVPNDVADRFLETKKRHDYVFERVPVGHDMGWRCYDPNHYDGDPADGDTRCGYGLTKDEAYVDYVGLPATSAERELDEAIDEALDRDVTFDDGLTDDDAR